MIHGVLFHTLRGRNGWSLLSHQKVDVAKVRKIWIEERWFMFCDCEYPFTLNIRYEEPTTTTNVAPTATSNGVGVAVYSGISLTQMITKRYPSREAAERDQRAIQKGQQQLQDYAQKLGERIRNEIK